jgi:methanol metabolism-related c-type cytochrome
MPVIKNPIRGGWVILVALFAGAAVSGSLVAGEAPEEQTMEEVLATITPVGPDEGKPYTVYNGELFDVVDYPTFNGFRRYHADCHICHGPDGLGSTYAPALTESLKTITFEDFFEVTMSGRERTAGTTKYVMPEFGTNPNVANHVEDIYSYLKARSDGVLRRGRPHKLPKAKATASEE